MVGVPRSTGCSICVRRHVRCDETRPNCLRCQKSGRSCPGYTKRFVFKQSSLVASKSKRLQHDRTSSSEELQVVPYHAAQSGTSGPLTVHQNQAISSFSAPVLEQSQLLAQLMAAFFPQPNSPVLPAEPQYNKSWLSLVHARAGENPSLDLSVRSLVCLYNGLSNNDVRMTNTGRSTYVNALVSLRNDITNGKSSHSDIQSSTMMLTFYEFISNRTEETWIKHSGGASQIMRLRGPQAYSSGMDYAMYLSCRSYIMIEAFVKDKPCFLEEPGWEALTRLSASPRFLLQERMFLCHARAPRLFRDSQNANQGQHDVQDVIDRAIGLRTTMKQHFKDWWDDLIPDLFSDIERPSDDDLFPVIYWFPNVISPGLVCSHYTVLILLNQLLIDAEHAESKQLIAESRAAAVEICKCVTQSQRRLLMSMYMPYWLQVAAEACAPEHYVWIMSKLDHLRTNGSSGTASGGYTTPSDQR